MMKRSAITDKLFLWAIRGAAWLVIGIVIAIFLTLVFGSQEAFTKFGFSFLHGTEWDPVFGNYGARTFVVGTLVTSLLALIIAIPFSLAISLTLGEFLPRGRVATTLTSLVELLAGIPSIIYGFWALFYLVPLMRDLEAAIGMPPVGIGILSASLILSIMVIPFSASIGREVIRMVPGIQKEGAYALGATRFEVIRDVVLPAGKSGILAGVFLALGRALGETMAVTMVIGNAIQWPENFFSLDTLFLPGNTIASVIANEFAEAGDPLYTSALTLLGLVLFLITGALNLFGKMVIRRMSK